MSYTIKKSDGTTLASVPENDIVLDAASVALIGRGATNYGAAHSEAFVHILENFAHSVAPAHPLDGQLWFDKNVSSLKVYNGGTWNTVGGSGSGFGTNVGGPIYVPINEAFGIVAMVAGGKVISVVSPRNVAYSELPVSIQMLNQTIPLRARFPLGVEAGHNLADDPEDYIYYGHVPRADASNFVGGGNPFAATSFIDLGPTSVVLTVSNNVLISAQSAAIVAADSLPTNYVVNGITMPFRAAFPTGLRKGLTLADGMSLFLGGGSGGGGVTTEIQALYDAEVTARASAITELYAYANSHFATAGLVNSLSSTFTDATGQSTLAEAIEYLITIAGSGTANAQYALDLEARFTDALGATSFANALQILTAAVTGNSATATDLTALESSLHNDISDSVSKAMQGLYTRTTGTPKTVVKTATTANIALVGEQTINGVLTAGSRVLVKNQTNAAENGVYVSGGGQWVRSTDCDEWVEAISSFVLVDAGTLEGTAWLSSGASNGILGTSAITWDKADLETAFAGFKTKLNTEFETATGYSSFAEAVNDMTAQAGPDGSIARQDTDLRTRFTNAMKVGQPEGAIQTLDAAFVQFQKHANGIADLDALTAAVKALTPGFQGTNTQAYQTLVSDSKLNSAKAQWALDLTASYVDTINDLTGTDSTTFAGAMTNVIATATSDGTGSTSSVDTGLRTILQRGTDEPGIPNVTSEAAAIQKLMTNTTATRALSVRADDLEAVFKTGLNTQSITSAKQLLKTVADNASAGATYSTALRSAFLANTNTPAGPTDIATAVASMWTKATDFSRSAAWGFTIEAGNKIAGIQALTDTSTNTSSIAFRADNFKFWHPSTADIVPFEIVNNEVRIRNLLISDGSLGWEKLKQLSFTNEVYVGAVPVYNANQPLGGGVLTINTGPAPAGSKVIMWFSCNVTGSDSGGAYISVRRNDGVYCQGTAEFGNPDEGGSAQSWTWHDTIPATGSYSYTLWGRQFGSTTIRSAHLIGLIQKQVGDVTGSGAGGAEPPPVSGGGYYNTGTGGYTDPSGGGSGCVEVNSYMPDGTLAGQVYPGYTLTVLNYNNMDEITTEPVNYLRVMPQPCVRIESSSGIWLNCSLSTPLTLKSGEVVYGKDVLGKELAVLDAAGFRWERIVSVSDIGTRDVAMIAANNQTYAAGGEPDRFIFTHNTFNSDATKL